MSTTTRFTSEELSELERKNVIPRFIFMPVGLVFAWCNYTCWPVEHWAVQTLWILAFGYVMLCWTSCFHETAHQTLTTRRWINILIGRILGTIIGVPYTVYRESHIRHHAYLNSPKDWELWPYSDPKISLGFRRVFVWIDLLFGFLTAAYTYGRMFFHKDSPITNSDVRKTIWKEYLGIAVFWSTFLGTVAYFHAWHGFVIMWLLPHMTAGFMQNCRKLTEHLGMSSYDPLQGTRTVISQSWLTRLGNYLNFDIFTHGPHHRHPKVPHDKLQEKMRDYQSKHPTLTYPVFNSYLGATWDMLPSLWKCPGVGVNAGWHDEKADAEDVQDFVADVVRDLPSNQHLETGAKLGNLPPSAPSEQLDHPAPDADQPDHEAVSPVQSAIEECPQQEASHV
jgi:fatty acid desaturase